jgi:hypothetical protein
MPSKFRRLPADPDAQTFENHGYLVNLAARLADLAFFGQRAEYETEVAEANRHLSKAEVGFVLGYIACANAPPDDASALVEAMPA